jgi:hypothetical protein
VTISLFDLATESFAPMLRSLSEILDKAAEHVKAKKIDPAKLVDGRLAPDMFPLTRQVQLACDHAVSTFARLMGVEAPKVEDNERTLEQLKTRIDRTLDYLKSGSEAKFAGAETRKIEVPGPPGMKFEFTGLQLLRDWALPHFYFHAVTAYDILRHNGIEIGKRDYLSNVGKYIKQG